MKKYLLALGLIFGILQSVPVMAQQHFDGAHVCGLKGEDAALVKQRLLKNREEMRDFARQRGAITYVPIKIHLVANNDGQGRVEERAALDMLCILNGAYLSHEIQFYIKSGFNYIDHTPLYQNPTSSAAFIKMNEEKANNAINVFVNLTIGTSGGGGNTLAYYQPPIEEADWIVIASQYMYGQNVLPHEIGHFFSLSHPFHGWDNDPWNEADYGFQVGNFILNTMIETERMDQSNCTTAGDGICDTPPDYLFAVSQSDCSEWNIPVKDVNGVVVDPMENNLMSYFSNCPFYELTPDQVDAIHMSLESSGRDYVNPGGSPSLNEISSLPNLIYPANQSTVAYTSILFRWDPSEGATRYLLEIAEDINFIDSPQYFVTEDIGKTVTSLENNQSYFWRVRPFTRLKTCTGYSSIYSFNTANISVNTNNIEAVQNWLVRPNPVQKNSDLVIEMNSTEAFNASVKLFSLTGQLINSANHLFNVGASTYELNTNNLSTGMYIVSVQTSNGVMTKKVVVR